MRMVDHVCKICLGRIVETSGNNGVIATCTNCGLTGNGFIEICACGLMLKNGKPAGLRCEENPNPTPEMPSKIVAKVVTR